MKTIAIATLALGTFAGAASAALVAGWNFNTTGSQAALFTPSSGSGSLTTTFAAANVTNFTGSTINAVGGAPAGQALAMVNQASNGQSLTIQVNLTGFENPVFTFAGQRTGTGFNSNQFAWSTDGVNFTNFGSTWTLPSSFALQTFDFSSVNQLDNAATAYIRITFSGASSASGNNRLDNFQINASPIVPTPGAAALMGLGALALGRRRRA